MNENKDEKWLAVGGACSLEIVVEIIVKVGVVSGVQIVIAGFSTLL